MNAAKRRELRRWIGFAGVVTALTPVLWCPLLAHAAMPIEERQRVEGLLKAVAQSGGVRFERNGQSVNGADAARFLRAKWERQGSTVTTAEDFINQIATRSSTTGQTYRVCVSQGACIDAASWLRQRLSAMEASAR